MSFVSLQGFVPSPRFDGTAWIRAFIQEAQSSTGPWTTIETVTLSPVDDDPENPITRNFSFDGTLANGWYRITFSSTGDAQQETTRPIHNIANYVPQVSQVGALIRSRTKDTAGNELGTFTDDTRPTYDQVTELIQSAVNTLSLRIGSEISPQLVDEASRLAALRAAMLVEVSYFPEQIASNKSPYTTYKDMWEEGYGDGTSKKPGTLVQAIVATGRQTDGSIPAADPGNVAFSFPAADNIGSRRM